MCWGKGLSGSTSRKGESVLPSTLLAGGTGCIFVSLTIDGGVAASGIVVVFKVTDRGPGQGGFPAPFQSGIYDKNCNIFGQHAFERPFGGTKA